MQFQRELGKHAKRAFGANQQTREVIPGRSLLGAAGGTDFPPVRHYRFHRQHVVFHGAVANRVGTRSARCCHAAEACVSTRVNRKKQPGVAQVLVQRLACHAWLHSYRQVFLMDLDDLVHLRHIDADAAVRGVKLPLQRRSRAKRDHRTVVLSADPDNPADILGVLCKHDSIRRLIFYVGSGVCMLFAHGSAGLKPFSKALAQDIAGERNIAGVAVGSCLFGH